MSNSIDQKIVEMQFDNAKFNENVKSTINAMEELDRSMTLGNKGTQALSKLSSKLKESGSSFIVNGLRSVRSGLSSIADAASNAFGTLVGKAQAAARVVTLSLGAAATAVGGLIVAGGTKRALNLEHANFQLKGLLKDSEKVEAVMSDVNKSVDGTAYGLDEAAVVAAQLAASGIQAGEGTGQMYDVLKGIAGVAAMGGAEYSRVGQIFATVAGNGRLMGDQLLQLSSMGLNAASTLRDYFKEVGDGADHTEEEIRDMVSKGEISFETFASAMSWAFGEHATKANETFTGAMSNVKAALSRIGAEFAIPSIENLRRIFVSLIPVINTIKKAMSPMVDLFKSLTTGWTDSIVNFFDSWAKKDSEGKTILVFADKLKRRFENIEDYISLFAKTTTPLFSVIFSRLSQLFRVISTAFEGAFGQKNVTVIYTFVKYLDGLVSLLIPVVNYLGALNATLLQAFIQSISDAVPGVLALGEKIAPAVERVGLSIRNAFPTDMVTGLSSWGSAFTAFVESLDIPESFYENISKIADSVLGFIKVIGNIAGGLFDGAIEAFKGLIEGLISLASSSNFVKTALAPLNALTDFLNGLQVPDKLRELGSALGEFFRNLGSGKLPKGGILEGLSHFFDGIADAVSKAGLLDSISGAITRFVNSISGGLTRLLTGSEDGNILKSLADFGNHIPEKIIGFFENLGKKLRQFADDADLTATDIQGLVNTIVVALSGLLATNVLRDVGEKWYTFVSNMARGVLNVAAFDLDDRWKQIKVVAKDFVITMSTTFKISNMLKIAAAIAILAGAMWLLSTMDPQQIAVGLSGVVGIMAILIKAMDMLAVSSKAISFMQLSSLSATLVGFAAAILILALAVRILGSADFPSLTKGIVGLGAATLILVSVLESLSKLEGSVLSSALAIGAIATAMLVMAAAIAIFGHMKLETLAQGLTAIGATLMVFVVALGFLGGIKGPLISAAAAILILSQAMLAMSVVLRIIGGMSLEQLTVALIGFGGCLLTLAFALEMLDNPKTLAGAASMAIAATAMLLLAPALLLLSTIPIEGLAVALMAIAGSIGVFAIMAIAVGETLAPMLALAGVLALLATSVALAGAGIALFGVGFATIVALGTAGCLVLVNAFQMLVTALITMLPQIGAAVLNTILTLFQSLLERTPALCEAIVGAVSALLTALATLAPQFISLGVVLLMSLLQAAQIVIPEAVNTALMLILALANGIVSALPALIAVGYAAMITAINSMADVIRNGHQELYAAGKNLFLAILEAMADMFGDLLTDLGNFINDIPAYISGEKELFASLGSDIGEATKTNAADSLSDMKEVTTAPIDEAVASMKETVDTGTEDMFSGLPENLMEELGGLDLSGVGTEQMNALVTSLSDTSAFQNVGQQGATAYTDGATKKLSELPSQFSGKVSEANKAAGGKSGEARTEGSGVGSAFGSSVHSGMSSWYSDIGDKAASLVSNAKSRANAEMNASSPAKDLIQSGIWFGQGFEIGITTMIKPVGEAAAAMVQEAKKPFEFDKLLSSTNVIPWDETPAIRPVLDLTDYESGLNQMQNLNTYAPLVSAQLAGYRRVTDTPYGYYSNANNMAINLYYGSGSTASDMVNEMASILQTKNLMEA